MGSPAAVEVKGAAELRRAIRRAQSSGLGKMLAVANKDAAEVVVKAAHPPRRSGRLANSMRALGSQRMGRARAGGGGVEYAGAIHWGRRSGNVGSPPGNHKGRNPIKGRPFLTDAALRNGPAIARQYDKSVADLVKEIERDARV